MILGFYYHIPIFSDHEGIKIPSYLGVFINALANEVGQLVLVMHEVSRHEINNCDYLLPAKNVVWINIGKKTPAWHRAVFHRKILKKYLNELHVDYLLVRSPSPLAPFFKKYFSKETIRFLIVGDYESGIVNNFSQHFRKRVINLYLKYFTYLFEKAIKETPIIVNSPELYDKYKGMAPSCQLISTTTLSKNDFFERDDTCQGDFINLIYTGRFDLQKGLIELLVASSRLIMESYPIQVHLVGWEDNPNKPVENLLKNKAIDLGILNQIFFHGKKKVGEELNQFYRMADIYVIPSYHEGFPRTIWEAMANSLPVIATKVGAIPKLLTNEVHALLIPPQNTLALKNSIVTMIEDQKIRKNLIKNGRELSSGHTLDVLTKKLIQALTTND